MTTQFDVVANPDADVSLADYHDKIMGALDFLFIGY